MNIEIVEFYPLESNEDKGLLTGTIRVKIPEIGIHILGIYVSKRKNFWYFKLPGRKGTHHETGEPILFPFIVFEDQEKNRSLLNSIREQGRNFIEKRLADTEKPLIFPQKHQAMTKQTRSSKTLDNSTEAKETLKAKPISSIAKKEWRDPPPTPAISKNLSKFARG
jgi:hypothetical protein